MARGGAHPRPPSLRAGSRADSRTGLMPVDDPPPFNGSRVRHGGATRTSEGVDASAHHSGYARVLAGAVGILLTLDIWVIAGTPWWPFAVLIGGAILVRGLRRFVPRGLRYLIAITGQFALLVRAPQLVWALLFLTAGGLLSLVLLGNDRRALDTTRNRAWLAAAAGLVFAGIAGLAVDQTAAERRQAADQEQASALSRASMLPTTPDRVVQEVLAAVVVEDPVVCALALSPSAAAQLTAATGAADCRAALHTLAAQVVDPRRYSHPDYDTIVTSLAPGGQSAIVDACHLTWHGPTDQFHDPTTDQLPIPGPQLGRLDLTRILGKGFQITHYGPC